MNDYGICDNKCKTLQLRKLTTDDILSQITQKQNTRPHKHDCIEIFFVIQGSATHVLNRTSSKISVGDAFILMPNDKHWFSEQSDDFLHRDILISLEYFKKICAVYDSELYSFFNDKNSRHIIFDVDEIYAIEQTCLQLAGKQTDLKKRSEAMIVTTVINDALKQYKASISPNWLQKIAKHLSSPDEFKNSVAAIVAVYPYSTSYICRTFKQHYGMPINNFFNRKKTEYAKILLSTTDYTIEQICEAIGFNSVSYFCKLFKKITGSTPSAIRKST